MPHKRKPLSLRYVSFPFGDDYELLGHGSLHRVYVGPLKGHSLIHRIVPTDCRIPRPPVEDNGFAVRCRWLYCNTY